MWLPQELAMLIGSYLDPQDLQMCTTQLCSSGAGFVANLFKNDGTTVRLHELLACCRLSRGVDDVARACIERIKSFLKRRGNVRTIVLRAILRDEFAVNASVYSNIHRRLQQVASSQLSQNEEICIEWDVCATSTAQVESLLKVDAPMDGARVSDTCACGAIRQCLYTLSLSNTLVSEVSVLASCQSLHTLYLACAPVSDVSALASCENLHTLYLGSTEVSDVSALALCQSLHTLDLGSTEVSDVSALASCHNLHTLGIPYTMVSDVTALASCQNLHTLNLRYTEVRDVTALASCQSLHTLNLGNTEVSDVSVLASCRSLHTLFLHHTQVSDVTALASCQSLHTLDLSNTQVSDVSALASCQSLRELSGAGRMFGNTNVLRIIQDRC